MSTDADHRMEHEVAILARILGDEDGGLPVEVARYVLGHEISKRDKARMHELAERNQNDELTPEEKGELQGFAKAATVLSILKSRARRTLGVAVHKTSPR